MFYGGISTFIVGVLFGSYFGVGPAVFKLSFLEKFWLLDPIKDTVLFMIIAFGLGYAQLFMAQIIKIISGKRNNHKEMLFSGIAWTATPGKTLPTSRIPRKADRTTEKRPKPNKTENGTASSRKRCKSREATDFCTKRRRWARHSLKLQKQN